jgi:hypothetical protein
LSASSLSAVCPLPGQLPALFLVSCLPSSWSAARPLLCRLLDPSSSSSRPLPSQLVLHSFSWSATCFSFLVRFYLSPGWLPTLCSVTSYPFLGKLPALFRFGYLPHPGQPSALFVASSCSLPDQLPDLLTVSCLLFS